MPHVLIPSRLIMLPCRNPITSICTFHCKRCKLGRAVNFNSIIRREFKNVLEMFIRNNKNMSFIIWPLFARYKCGHIFILVNDISLLSSHINTTKRAFVSFRLMRICFHSFLFSPFVIFLSRLRRRQSLFVALFCPLATKKPLK